MKSSRKEIMLSKNFWFSNVKCTGPKKTSYYDIHYLKNDICKALID